MDWIGKRVRVIKKDIGDRTASKVGTVKGYDSVLFELKTEDGKIELITVQSILRVEVL